MNKEERLRSNLQEVQNQIVKMDNKANMLITIVGIIFAISLSMLGVFHDISNAPEMTHKLHMQYICLIVFSAGYFISFAAEIGTLVSVVFPRRKKPDGIIALSYYGDVAKLSIDKIKDELNKQEKETLESLVEQLKVNSMICNKKHNRVVTSIWLLIPLFIFMFALFFTAII